MPWRRIRWALTTLLCFWLLMSNVSVSFTPVRRKLVRAPQSGQHGISVALDGIDRFTDPHLVLVAVVRNDGPTPVNLSVAVGEQVLRQVGIAPRTTSRIDIAWPRPNEVPAPYRATLVGTGGTWTLAYLELANLHGFTRGRVNFLILPAAQRFGRAPAWWLVVLMGCALLLSTERAARWPRWLRSAWLVLATMIALVLIAVAVSPLVSPFRIVLSASTFVAGILVLAAPRAWELRRHLWMASKAVGQRLTAVPWPLVLAVVAVGAYAVFLASRVGAYAGGADASGYLNSARLLGLGRVSTPIRIVAGIPAADLPANAYVPVGFRPHGAAEMAPTYPIGLPLAVLATAQVTGWDLSPHVTMVWHALLGVGLMYWLSRLVGLSRGLSALAALILATSAQYVFSSLMMMSDTPALVWTTAAVLLAWRSRDNTRLAALAGAALAMAVLVRPTNILALAPVAVCLGGSARRWAWLCAGGAPGALLQLSYNASAYGRTLETGYGDVRSAFAVANVAASLHNYVAWLPVLLTPLVVLAAGLPFLRRSSRIVTVLVLWISIFSVVYAFYFHTHEAWWYLRFLLPAFPPLIAGALLVGRRLLDPWLRGGSPSWSRTRAAVAGFVIAASVLAHNLVWAGRLHAFDAGRGERVYFEAAEWTRAHLPRHSALLAMQTSGALFYYTDFPVLRWDRLTRARSPALVATLGARHQPLYAVLFPFEIEERRVLTHVLPGAWTLVGTVHHVTIWRLDGPPADAVP